MQSFARTAQVLVSMDLRGTKGVFTLQWEKKHYPIERGHALGRSAEMLMMEIDQVLGRLLMLQRGRDASVVGDLPRFFLAASLLNEALDIPTVFHHLAIKV